MPKTNTTKNSLLNNLHEANRALRVNLLRNDLQPVVRDHIERAIAHIEDAYEAECFRARVNNRMQEIHELPGLRKEGK